MKRRSRGWSLIACASLLLLLGCETVKPYEKEYLLEPLMDDAKVSALSAPLMSSAAGTWEKLGSAGSEAAGGGSCPTCGG